MDNPWENLYRPDSTDPNLSDPMLPRLRVLRVNFTGDPWSTQCCGASAPSMSTVSHNKENPYKTLNYEGGNVHLLIPQLAPQLPGPQASHAAMCRIVRQGRKQRNEQHSTSEYPRHDDPQPSEPEPMSIESPAPMKKRPPPPPPSNKSRLQPSQLCRVSNTISPASFLMPAIKTDAFAAIDER